MAQWLKPHNDMFGSCRALHESLVEPGKISRQSGPEKLCYDRMFNYHTIVNLTASCHSVSVIFSYAQAGI